MDATFVLVPGAGGAAWYWHRVVGELEGRGRNAIAVDLAASDDSDGLAEYTDVVVDAIGRRSPIVLVAQSMGGVVALRVALERPDLVRRLVLVATSGGVDMKRFGAGDWRAEYARRFPAARTWIIEQRPDLTDRLAEVGAPALLGVLAAWIAAPLALAAVIFSRKQI